MTYRISVDIDISADSVQAAQNSIDEMLQKTTALDYDITDVINLDEAE